MTTDYLKEISSLLLAERNLEDQYYLSNMGAKLAELRRVSGLKKDITGLY